MVCQIPSVTVIAFFSIVNTSEVMRHNSSSILDYNCAEQNRKTATAAKKVLYWIGKRGGRSCASLLASSNRFERCGRYAGESP